MAPSATATMPNRIPRIGQILCARRGCPRPVMYSSSVAVHLVQHPIVQDALTSLRDKSTTPSHFRRLTHRLSLAVWRWTPPASCP